MVTRDGEEVKLKNLLIDGDVIVLFMSKKCVSCSLLLEELNSKVTLFKQSLLYVIRSSDQSLVVENLRDYVKAEIDDSDGSIAAVFGVRTTPSALHLSSQMSVISARLEGPSDILTYIDKLGQSAANNQVEFFKRSDALRI